MSELTPHLITPVCKVTGVPYALEPMADLPPVPHDERNVDRIADWHHPFHPRADLVNGTLGQKALRFSRVQWAKYSRHHSNVAEGYHSLYLGPPLPETEEDQFRAVVFAAAGYIPPRAIAFRRNEKKLTKPLKEEARWQLLESSQIKIDKPIVVRDFIIEYALKREFVDVNDPLVDEFLSPNTGLLRRQQIGNSLLRVAAHESVTPINPLYRQAKRERLIHPSNTHSAGEFVVWAMGLAAGRVRAYRELQQRLRPAA